MADPSKSTSFQFSAHPSVVFQLGASLISDDVQALVELIKNCYDADAQFAKVTISSKKVDIPESRFQGAQGFIVIKDDGVGMNAETIQRGWLTISDSPKRETKRRKEITQLGRTPLGDKGLGRLGTQRLGMNLEIITRCANDKLGHHIAFSWSSFAECSHLEAVQLYAMRVPCDRGTTVIISNLTDLDRWNDSRAVKKLKTDLSQMISPFEEVRRFLVYVTVNDTIIELADISKKLRNAAPIRYSICFDGSTLHVHGQVKMSVLCPKQDPAKRRMFEQLVAFDGGDSLFSMITHEISSELVPVKRGKNGFFLDFSESVTLHELDGCSFNGRYVANPGPFYGEVDAFDLNDEDMRAEFGKLGEYRKYVREVGGIRVYRDGFSVRVDNDWLELGKQQTSGGSYYGLRPGNVAGFVAISAADNMVLEETTDREGFKTSPYYDNFYLLLQRFVTFSGEWQERFRRLALDYVKNHHAEQAKTTINMSADDLTDEISNRAMSAVAVSRSLNEATDRLAIASRKIATTAQELVTDDRKADRTSIVLKNDLANLTNIISSIHTLADGSMEHFALAEKIPAMASMLRDKARELENQLSDLFHLVGLGITAETLTHEIASLANRLEAETASARELSIRGEFSARNFRVYIERVATGVSSIRRELAHYLPSLKYAREKRDRISIRSFLNELASYHTRRLAKYRIKVSAICDNDLDFIVLMNRGRLTQIFDNLVLNSEYWIREEQRVNSCDSGEITLKVTTRGHIEVWDSAAGVDPTVEKTLFEPFITRKRRLEGRGLGLFIVKQYLLGDSCDIRLLGERNNRDRRYKFDINLSGGIADDK